jgi:hypothetical protein
MMSANPMVGVLVADDNGNLVWKFGDLVLNFGGGVGDGGKRRRSVTAHKVVDTAGGTVTWYWADGLANTISLVQFDANLQRQFALHGISQKLGDCYASATSVREARESFDALVDQLNGGDWEKKREGGGNESGSMLVRAAAEAFGVTVAEAALVVKELTAKEKATLELDPAVAKVMMRLRQERAGTSGDDITAKFKRLVTGDTANGDPAVM